MKIIEICDYYFVMEDGRFVKKKVKMPVFWGQDDETQRPIRTAIDGERLGREESPEVT